MAGQACPAWRQAGISPGSRGRLGPSVPTGPAAPVQDTALLHLWKPGAPLQGWWANRWAALQTWWSLTMQDHGQGRGRHHWHPPLMQKMRVLPDPNSHATTSCSIPKSCHPKPPASIWEGHYHPSRGLHSWVTLQAPWLSPSSLLVAPDHYGPAVGALLVQVPLTL